MNPKHRIDIAARLFFSISLLFLNPRASAAVKSWIGAGDATSWSDTNNWSGGTLPLAGDEVVINVADTNTIITYNLSATVTLRNLQCEETLNITAGAITLTNGLSWSAGGLGISPDRTLTVKGAGTTFTAGGSAAINGAFLSAQNGATISLPGALTYSDTSGCCGASLEATGAGSTLDLSSVTNLTGNPSWQMSIRALSGGQVLLSSLTRIEPSQIRFR